MEKEREMEKDCNKIENQHTVFLIDSILKSLDINILSDVVDHGFDAFVCRLV